jgi:hypothetical protein
MSGLPWIKVAVVLPGHPKLQALEKFLQVEDGLGMLVRLWCWTANYYPDGEIPRSALGGMERVVAADLSITYGSTMGGAIEAGGPPRPGDVTEALVSSGWLDPLTPDGDRYRVHDWSDFQEAHADKAEREKAQIRERVRKFRNRKKNNSMSLPSSVTVTVTGNASNALEESRGEGEEIRNQPTSGLAGESLLLRSLRERLTADLSLPSLIHAGSSETQAFMQAQIDAVGLECLITDCRKCADLSKAGIPSSLNFFPGWLKRLPIPKVSR